MDHFYRDIEGCFSWPDFCKWIAMNARVDWYGVEVGSLNGQSAACLAVELGNWKLRARLDLVELSDKAAQLELVKARSPVIGRIWSPMSSLDASTKYPDNSLDFVFLDADHSLEGVRQDIAVWLPKLRTGGILAGHDFCSYFPAVARAVLERFPRVELFRGDEWPGDDVPAGPRRDAAEADFRARSAHGGSSDYLATWWAKK